MKRLSLVPVAFFLLFSCSNEPERSAAPVSTEKSMLDELKDQTAKNPKDVEAWVHIADIYDRDAQYQDEIAALKKVITIAPDRKTVYLNLANTYSRLGQYHDAVVNYQIAIRSFPKNPVLHNNLAVAYGKSGDADNEIAALQKAIALRPRYSTARFNLGIALLKKGNKDLAMKQYDELKKFDEGAAASLKKEIDTKREKP
jgi:tetratricopeptide (TPR) repeat protein